MIDWGGDLKRFLQLVISASIGSASAGVWVALAAWLHGNWSGGPDSVLHSVRLSLLVTVLPNVLGLWLVEMVTDRWMTPIREWHPVTCFFVGTLYGLSLLWVLGVAAHILSPETALTGVDGSIAFDFHLAAALAGMTTIFAQFMLRKNVRNRDIA